MILIFQEKNELNNRACAALSGQKIILYKQPSEDLTSKDDILFFVEINPDANFPYYYPPENIARWLIENKLSNTIQKIIFLVPNITRSNRNIFNFVQPFIDELARDKNFSNAKAYVAFESQYSNLFFSPPEQNSNSWRVYGFNNESTANKSKSSYDELLKLDNKVLVYEGKAIIEWMETSQKSVSLKKDDSRSFTF